LGQYPGRYPRQEKFRSIQNDQDVRNTKNIDVHFVQNGIDPTGLGEPGFLPVFGALANALYNATGKGFYKQPFGTRVI